MNLKALIWLSGLFSLSSPSSEKQSLQFCGEKNNSFSEFSSWSYCCFYFTGLFLNYNLFTVEFWIMYSPIPYCISLQAFVHLSSEVWVEVISLRLLCYLLDTSGISFIRLSRLGRFCKNMNYLTLPQHILNPFYHI